MPQFAAVVADDFEAMLALRIAALRESLERLGRFDPQRARERLQAGFAPAYMQHIEEDGQRLGFLTLRPTGSLWQLDHLYLWPAAQGRGLGSWALQWAQTQARLAGAGIALSALKRSDANRFYLRHGFNPVAESDFDIDYRWQATA